MSLGAYLSPFKKQGQTLSLTAMTPQTGLSPFQTSSVLPRSHGQADLSVLQPSSQGPHRWTRPERHWARCQDRVEFRQYIKSLKYNWWRKVLACRVTQHSFISTVKQANGYCTRWAHGPTEKWRTSGSSPKKIVKRGSYVNHKKCGALGCINVSRTNRLAWH